MAACPWLLFVFWELFAGIDSVSWNQNMASQLIIILKSKRIGKTHDQNRRLLKFQDQAEEKWSEAQKDSSFALETKNEDNSARFKKFKNLLANFSFLASVINENKEKQHGMISIPRLFAKRAVAKI